MLGFLIPRKFLKLFFVVFMFEGPGREYCSVGQSTMLLIDYFQTIEMTGRTEGHRTHLSVSLELQDMQDTPSQELQDMQDTLSQALSDCLALRPQDPIAHIADFLHRS